MSSKFSPEAQEEIRQWIGQVLNESVPNGDIFDVLKDGVLLCRVVNTIEPGIAKCKASVMPFVQMENIAAFLRACDKLGVPHHELFETVDLYEQQNTFQVITTLRSLSRHAHNKNEHIPVLGPKLSKPQPNTGSPRHFNPQNIPAWNTRQYGYMGGASQSSEGVVIGGTHQISIGSSCAAKTQPKKSSMFDNDGKKQNQSTVKSRPRPFVSSIGSGSGNGGNQACKLAKPGLSRPPIPQSSLVPTETVQESTLVYDEVYDTFASNKTGPTNQHENQSQYMDEMKRAKRKRDMDRVVAQDILLKRQRMREKGNENDEDVFVTSAYKAQQAQIAQALAQDEREKDHTNKSKTGLYQMYNGILELEDQKKLPSQTRTESNVPIQQERPRVGLNENGEVIDDKKTLKGGLNVVAVPQKPTPSAPPQAISTDEKTQEAGLSKVELARKRFLERKKESN